MAGQVKNGGKWRGYGNRSAPRVAGMVVLLLTVLAAGTSWGGGKGENRGLPREVVIGFQNIPNGEIIAKAKGWHEEELGVPVRWVQINSASELNTAMAGGSVDFGLAGSSGVAAGIATGIDYEVIWVFDVIGDNEALVARDDTDIRTVADLVGKKVAVPFASTTHYHLLVALGLAGIDPEKVTILDLQPPDILAAWQRGDIDATFVWEPTLAKVKELSGHVVISSRSIAAQGYLTGDIGVVRGEFARKYPELVAKYLKTQVRAVDYYRSNPDDAAKAVASQFEIPVEEAARQMKSLVLLSGREQLAKEYLGDSKQIGALATVFKETADFLVTQKTIKAAPEVSAFAARIKPSFLESALGE